MALALRRSKLSLTHFSDFVNCYRTCLSSHHLKISNVQLQANQRSYATKEGRHKLTKERGIEINMDEEIQRYEIGKRWLARMMEEDPDTFNQNDVERSLAYLVPSGLFAKDARPTMKHPNDLFPEQTENAIDKNGRPISAAYYTGQPHFHNLIYEIYQKSDELDSTMNLKTNKEKLKMAPRTDISDEYVTKEIVRWVNRSEMENILTEKIVDKQLELLLFRLKRLSKHPMASTIEDFLTKFQKPVIQANVNIQKGEVDEQGRGHAIGYRKRAIAEVWLTPGNGTVTVNDRSFIDYFPILEHRQQIMYPFLIVDKLRQYNIEANTIGGGLAGQSNAIRLGVSRALASLSDTHESALLRANLLIRDPRRVERKKPGQKKARKKYAWVKR